MGIKVSETTPRIEMRDKVEKKARRRAVPHRRGGRDALRQDCRQSLPDTAEVKGAAVDFFELSDAFKKVNLEA
jgi:hypothetical protein